MKNDWDEDIVSERNKSDHKKSEDRGFFKFWKGNETNVQSQDFLPKRLGTVGLPGPYIFCWNMMVVVVVVGFVKWDWKVTVSSIRC